MGKPALELGIDPESLIVHLTTGADFDGILRSKVAGELTDWPEGTVWSLVFANGVTWTAATDGPLATFHEDKAATGADAMPHALGVKLRYVNGSTDRIYYTGSVARHG